jgi:DNA topoisomerase VI subunit A
VIARIEGFISAWLAVLTDPGVREAPTFEVVRREASNTTLVAQPGGAGLPALVHGEAMVVKKLRSQGARSYAAIFAVLAFAHKLLLANQRATSRELFYHVKTQQAAFRVQSDADTAVIEAATLLGVPRHQLGVVGAAKGLLAGRFRFRVRFFEQQGQDGQQQGQVAMGEWQDCSTGTLVDCDWVGA